jgi:hypothetical protein
MHYVKWILILFLKWDFLCDVHRQIVEEFILQLPNITFPLVVYRGQQIFNNEFEKLRKNEGGFLSFNSFYQLLLIEILIFNQFYFTLKLIQ